MARFSSKNSDCVSLSECSCKRSESERTRSTTRPSRVEVERIIVPLAEISTAGVIIDVKTANDADRPSINSNHFTGSCLNAHSGHAFAPLRERVRHSTQTEQISRKCAKW